MTPGEGRIIDSLVRMPGGHLVPVLRRDGIGASARSSGRIPQKRRLAHRAAFFDGIRVTASAAFSVRRLLLGKEAGPLAHGYTF